MANPSRRIVKVIIIDPDDRVPLEKCILFSGDEKLTDLTDQELFFEVPINGIRLICMAGPGCDEVPWEPCSATASKRARTR